MNLALLAFSGLSGTYGSTLEDGGINDLNDVDLTYEGELEGFDINDVINNNDLFDAFARNYSSLRGSDPRLRNMRNEMQPIDFSELTAESMEMMASTRKFKHVAGLIMFKQAVPILGKYVFYGCYCFSDAQYELDAGKGRPVDSIDAACKSFHQCYRCVNKDFVQEAGQASCDGTSRSYRFKGIVDEVTGSKQIVCLNKPGTCKRGICECDKALADDLSDLEFKWDIMNHQRWGGFSKDAMCVGLGSPRTARSIDGTGVQQCCGEYPNRFIYTSEGKDGSRRGCCNGKTFDLGGHLECCEGNQLVPIGECAGQTTVHQPYNQQAYGLKTIDYDA